MLNRCEFIGNLGGDPEVKYTPSGTAVANFSIAVTEKWTQDGEKKERTEWVRCVAWKRLAEIAGEYLRKGSKIFLAGTMQTRDWEDKEGVKRYTTEIVVRELEMLGDRPNNQSDNGRSAPPAASMPEEDDISF